MRSLMTMWLACGFVLTSLAATHAQERKPAPVVSANHAANMAAGTELFKSQVRGLLTQHCLECHGGKSVKADFDLSTREALLASGAIEKAARAVICIVSWRISTSRSCRTNGRSSKMPRSL